MDVNQHHYYLIFFIVLLVQVDSLLMLDAPPSIHSLYSAGTIYVPREVRLVSAIQ